MSGHLDVIKALGTRFIERRDVKAVQGEGIPWQPIREKFTVKDFEDHLSGKRTFGHYLVSPEGNCKFFAFDIDLDKQGQYFDESGTFHPCNPRDVVLDPEHPGYLEFRHDLRNVAEGFARKIDRILGVPTAIAWSGGKGLHVYGFTGTKQASVVRTLAAGLMDDAGWLPTRGDNFFKHPHHATNPLCYPHITIEIFPKQDSVGADGFGNLMALPLGVHKGTGQEKYFCRLNEETWTVNDPVSALNGDIEPWE